MVKKKKKQNLETTKREIDEIITQRYVSDDSKGSLFIFILLMLSILVIFHGGYSKNIYEIISGGIVLVFLYFSLK